MAVEQYSTALAKVNDTFLPMIQRQLQGNGVNMDGYAKQCVLAALSAIHTALDSKGIQWGDAELDKSSLTQVLLSIAALKLNAAASPREVYFQVRNVKTKVRGENGKEVEVWKKQIEMGIEGDGNDSILARFGRGVREVRQFWLVREGDEFVYPRYNGLEFEPPKWTPTGKGVVVRVVYPIIKTDGVIEFYIGEREDVGRNLLAHMKNNLMNETFGIAKSRYDATPDQKKKIDSKKAEILKRAQAAGLDVLDDPDLEPWISPAWTEYHSREQMIIRKMRNNVVKKIPKDFGSAYIEMTYAEQTDEAEADLRREIAERANYRLIDVTPEAGEPETSDADAAEVETDTDEPQTEGAEGSAEPTQAKPLTQGQRGGRQQQTLGVGAPGPGY